MNLRFHFFVVLLIGYAMASCKNEPTVSAAGSAGLDDSTDTVKEDDEIIMALLYQQRAAEYRALCLQCYNLARQRVAEELKDNRDYSDKPFAVVTDLDETALDNSANEAWLYLNDSAYTPAEFDHWSTNGKVGAVPGSVAFFNYVNALKDKRGRKVSIYYISNRTDTLPIIDSTISQMRQLGFPQLVASQFLFKGSDSSSSKESRRQKVSTGDTIILLLGDNLIDLNKAFDNTPATPEVRLARVDSLTDSWGNRFIVFPNAEYGDWEAAMYPNGKYPKKLSSERKFRLQSLKPADFK